MITGALQCSTCHTPHAVKARKGTLVSFFLRAPNENSALCKRCHLKNTGGSAAGNHPTEISAEKEYPAIVEAGGIFGTGKPNEIICETCHTPHGGVNNRRLVLSIEDPRTRSVLCEVCHTQQPGLSGDPTLNRTAHPLDRIPGETAHIPREWTNGDPVFLGTGGELVCRTCHRPHYAEDKEHLLVEQGSDGSLCVRCHHEQSPIIGSSHDLRKSAPGEKNILGKQADELGPCASCHLVHGGAEGYLWAKTVQETGPAPALLCSSCHAPGYCAEEALPKDFSHPMGVTIPEGTSPVSLPLFDARGKRNATGTISCSTCHDVHNPHPRMTDTPGANKQQETFLRTVPGPEDHSAICMHCHRDQSLVLTTKHDLRETDPFYTHSPGHRAEKAGVCSPCHVAHGAETQHYLWPGLVAPGLSGIENTGEGTPRLPVMVLMCTGCHAEGAAARAMPIERAYHPSDIIFPGGRDSSVWHDYPLFNSSGDTVPDGAVLCSTCHNPHQGNPSGVVKDADSSAVGTTVNSFLRDETHKFVCAVCHGEESLFKFLYFHRDKSRKKETVFPQLMRKR